MEEAEEVKMVEEFGIPDIAGRDKGATLLYYWIVTLTSMKVKAIVNRIRYRTNTQTKYCIYTAAVACLECHLFPNMSYFNQY